jgi:3-hydroxyisobutyrate dehydrogenase-like beta-hydroxyacid dehydrogenase
MDKRVGIVGIGIMGSAMAKNLMADGFEVVGFDVAEKAMAAFASAGGKPVRSPREVADRAPAVITSLATLSAYHAVMSGADGLAGSKGRPIVIDTCTMPLDAKEAARAALAASQQILLDCPVSGTGAQAAQKDLFVFASGDAEAFEKCLPVFQGMSRTQKYLGAFGNGSRMKFIANHLVNIHNVAAAEAFVLARKAGLDAQLVYDVISDSAGASRMFQVRGPLMVSGSYEPPTARVDLHIKDLDIITKFAADLHCPTPLFTAASQFYQAALSQGRNAQDTAVVCEVLGELAGLAAQATPARQSA